jgi:hypothetical protein
MKGEIYIKDLKEILLELNEQTMTVEQLRLYLRRLNPAFIIDNKTKKILKNLR